MSRIASSEHVDRKLDEASDLGQQLATLLLKFGKDLDEWRAGVDGIRETDFIRSDGTLAHLRNKFFCLTPALGVFAHVDDAGIGDLLSEREARVVNEK